MFIILHHVNQHRLGDPGFAMGFQSVDIQVTEAGTFHGTDLTVERFCPMDFFVVLLQGPSVVELFITFQTLLSFLPLHVGLQMFF